MSIAPAGSKLLKLLSSKEGVVLRPYGFLVRWRYGSLLLCKHCHVLCASVLKSCPTCLNHIVFLAAMQSTLFAFMFSLCLHGCHKIIAVAQVHKLDINVFYQSTPRTSHVSIPFPSGAPELASFYQGCMDQWAAQGFEYTVTGRLVVDNLWQPLYEAHCLRDTCGCTVFERTNISEHCKDGLRCGGSMAYVC